MTCLMNAVLLEELRTLQLGLSYMQVSISLTTSLILFLAFGSCVRAESWNALASGYAATTDCHGVDVPLGTPTVATAGTTDETVGLDGHVVFLWRFEPNDTAIFTSVIKLLESNGTTYYDANRKEHLTVYYADDTQVLTVEGDWGVQAFFYDTEGQLRGDSGIIKIRATSVVIVPEVLSPLLVAAALSGLSALWLKVHRWPHQKRAG